MIAKPLRIVHCLRAPVGGLFRHVGDLARAQAALGHDVGVVCDATAGDGLTQSRLTALEPSLSLGLLKTPMSRDVGLGDVTAFAAVRKFVVASDIDVIHGHGAKGGAYARLAARALKRTGRGVACIYTPHGGSLHYDPATLKGRIYMALERRLARLTDGIVFESAYSERVYRRQVGAPGCATAVIANGLATAEFTPVVPTAGAADFLFVGELRQLKGVDVLLDALAATHAPDGRPATAVIVGAGPDADAFKARAIRLGLGTRARFAGALPAREAFALGHTMVVPSRAESFPYVVLESAAAGLPLIATDVGGIPEIVAGTDTKLVPAGDVAALTAAMRAVLVDAAGAAARAARLREAVARRFTIASMTDAVLALYNAGLAGDVPVEAAPYAATQPST